MQLRSVKLNGFDFIKVITTNQSKVFDFQMHIMITADTKEELERTKVSLKSTLEAMEMRAIPLRFEQEKVLKSCLPIFDNYGRESYQKYLFKTILRMAKDDSLTDIESEVLDTLKGLRELSNVATKAEIRSVILDCSEIIKLYRIIILQKMNIPLP